MNFKNCEMVAADVKLPNLKFVKDDVRNVEKYGQFDVVFCCGLLYHLDNPHAFLKTVAKCATTAFILHTHYAVGQLPLERRPQSGFFVGLGSLRDRVRRSLRRRFSTKSSRQKTYYDLSSLVLNEGKWGRWFREYAPMASNEEIEENLWASYGNYRSFWLHKKELLQTLREVGFDIIYEQFDFLEDIAKDTYIEDHNRSLFVALKSDAIALAKRARGTAGDG